MKFISQDDCAQFVYVCVYAEATSYFLYNLIDSMSGGQVHAQEDKLRSFFNQLHAQVQTKNICSDVYESQINCG